MRFLRWLRRTETITTEEAAAILDGEDEIRRGQFVVLVTPNPVRTGTVNCRSYAYYVDMRQR